MHNIRKPCSILLYTQEPVLAMGMRETLADFDEFILLPAVSGSDALFSAVQGEPDVLIFDFEPGSTAELARRVLAERPLQKTVFWTRSISSSMTHEAMNLRVNGILRKNLPVADMLQCLRTVNAGETWLDPSVTTSYFRAKRIDLSPREGQLITLLAHGMKNKEIAQELRLSEGTVKVYLSRLFQKTGVRDRFDLALQGVKNLGMDPSGNVELKRSGRGHLRSLILDEVGVNGS